MFKGFKSKAQGFEHIRNGIICQDAVGFIDDSVYGIAIAADGHSSPKCFRSDRGAEFAVEASQEVLSNFGYTFAYEKTDEEHKSFAESRVDTMLKDMEEKILSAWRKRVKEDLESYPLNEKEQETCTKYRLDPEKDIFTFYGSTLAASFIAKDFWFILNIGDGWYLHFDENGQISSLWDYKHDPEGSSDSLCLPNALERFTHFCGAETRSAIMVITDGIADSYTPEFVQRFLKECVFELFINKDAEAFQDELDNILHKVSKKHSGDDVSIAGVFNEELVEKIHAAALAEHQDMSRSIVTQKDEAPISMQESEPTLETEDETQVERQALPDNTVPKNVFIKKESIVAYQKQLGFVHNVSENKKIDEEA